MTDVPTPRIMRSTRFVLVSDTNGTFPPLPKGDVLCHAGGLSPRGDMHDLRRTLRWLNEADFEVKIIIAGTQDITLHKGFFQDPNRPGRMSQDALQNLDDCFYLIRDYSPNIHYLHHGGRTIRLRSPTGPQTTFNIFGSPCVPKLNGNTCAFGYERQSDMAESLWSHIPLDTDILLTHTPAYNHRDTSTEWQAAGYEVLRKALWQVRPRLAVCGRIREARGIEKVQWELGQNYPQSLERQTTQIDNPNTRRIWHPLDMTRRGVSPLLNDGAPEQQLQQNHVSFSSEGEQSEATSSGTFDDSVSLSEVLTSLSGSSDMTAQTRVTQ